MEVDRLLEYSLVSFLKVVELWFRCFFSLVSLCLVLVVVMIWLILIRMWCMWVCCMVGVVVCVFLVVWWLISLRMWKLLLFLSRLLIWLFCSLVMLFRNSCGRWFVGC